MPEEPIFVFAVRGILQLHCSVARHYLQENERSVLIDEKIDAELGRERAQILDGGEVHGDPGF